MFETLDHIVIAVEDLNAAERVAVTLLGRTPAWAGRHAALGMSQVVFQLENTALELRAPDGSGPMAEDLHEWLANRGGPGLWALVFATPDATAEANRLKEAGLSPSEPEPGLAQDERSGAFRRFTQFTLPRSESHGVGLWVEENHSEAALMPPSLPVASEGGVVSRIDHVVVQTPDPERAIDLYGNRLGIRLALDRSFEKRGVRLLFFRVGGTTLEVASRLGADEPASAQRSDHLWGVAYQVPDIDQAHARLVEAGLDMTKIRDGHKPGTRVCSVRGDPLGVPTLVIEPVSE